MATTNPTLKDIAQRVGVSKNAVARVLLGTGGKNTRVGEATATRIRKVARQINYRPNRIAQQLAGGSTKMIGVVADSRGVEVHQRLLEMIERASQRAGYGMMVGQAWGEIDRIQRYLDDFRARRVDGIICFSHAYPEGGREIEQMFAGLDNVIFVWPPFEPMRSLSSYVTVDHAEGIRQLVFHLHEQGRRRIAMILGDPRWESNIGRLKGYRGAHEELGLDQPDDLLQISHDDLTRESQLERMVDRCLDARADAILASNDIVAMKVIRRLSLHHGLNVPGDLAVTGFDNSLASSLFMPSLTTVDMNIARWAEVTVELMLESIETPGMADPKHIVLKPEIVIRESTSKR